MLVEARSERPISLHPQKESKRARKEHLYLVLLLGYGASRRAEGGVGEKVRTFEAKQATPEERRKSENVPDRCGRLVKAASRRGWVGG